MPHANTAAILSVGEELLLGQITDTNASWLCGQLSSRGWKVAEIRTVGDELPQIVHALRELSRLAGVLIVTGGLGPTDDDLTRAALAEAAGVKLFKSEEALEQIRARFRTINRPMTPSNEVQALLPEGAKGIFNPCGTAPGVDVMLGTCRVFATPGVPREMLRMAADYVFPNLGAGGGEAIRLRELKVWGVGESVLGEQLRDLMARGRNPDVGTRVRDSIIAVRVVARAASPEAADALVERDLAEIRRRLGEAVFGTGDDTLADAVVRELSRAGKTLALAESCTGGLVGKMITDVSGSSAVLLEGFVTYTNTAKIKRLGVDEKLLAERGAVDREVALQMAEGARRASGADYGIGITGIAGPTGGTADKPVGLVHVAVCGLNGAEHGESRFNIDRDGNRHRAAHTALGMLLKMTKADAARKG